jgi:HEAT repeat protein
VPDGGREVEVLARLRQDDLSLGERTSLVKELRQVGSEASVEVLRENLRARDFNLGVDAVHALARIGSDAAIDALIECLAMEPTPRLTMAAVALRRLRPAQAVPAIIRCLQARGGELRAGQKRILILALGEQPHISAIPALTASLRDPHYRTRNAAAWAVAQIRAPESAAALEAAARDLSWLRALPIRRGIHLRRRRADVG